MLKRTGSTAQRLKELSYQERVCRIEHYPSSLIHLRHPRGPESSRAPRATMEEEIDGIAGAGTEVWVVLAQRGRGTPLWPSKMLETPPDADPKLLSRFLDLAHQKGIIVLAYHPFIWTRPLAKFQPDWMIQLLDDGGPELWNEGWFCWNSPYRDWLPEYLSELLDNLDFDGIFCDDMSSASHSDTGQRRTGGCHCQYCRELYPKETGKELPTKVDMDSVDFRRYVNWRYDKFKEGVEHVAKGVYAKHPHAIIDWNYYGRPYGPQDIGWKTAHPLNPLSDSTYFFMEAGLDKLGASFPAKLLEAAGSNFCQWLWATQMLPECHSHGAPYPEPYSATVFGLSAVVKGGASMTACLDAGDHTVYGDALKSMFTELKRLRPYVGGESVKYLALHVSQQTRDFGYIEYPNGFWQLMRGSHEMLKRSHILTDVILDQQLTYEHLSPYQVLFLSNSMCLSDEQITVIRRFVSEGGTLIATHQTSLYDELGQKRDNFGLSDVLGVDYQGPFPTSQEGAGTIESLRGGEVNPAECAIYIPQEKPLRDEFGHLVAFGAAQSEVSVRPNGDTRALFTKTSLKWHDGLPPIGMDGVGADFYAYADHDSGLPAVTENTFGKGKAIYVCGDVGEGYSRNPLPQLKRFVAYLVRTSTPPIELEAPRIIELSASMRGPKELMVHLLNNPLPFVPWSTSGLDMRKYFYIDEMVPVPDIRIKLNGFKVKRASLPLQGKELEVVGEPATITVPKVHIQEVVLLQLA